MITPLTSGRPVSGQKEMRLGTLAVSGLCAHTAGAVRPASGFWGVVLAHRCRATWHFPATATQLTQFPV